MSELLSADNSHLDIGFENIWDALSVDLSIKGNREMKLGEQTGPEQPNSSSPSSEQTSNERRYSSIEMDNR